ncbi:4'-phosphopantetheinyl transferase [Acetobacter orientalis]|uniref:Holo-[acyl-carrier-protein] synthase n=1 Tax=Acetobacter orientalis TaxID=146474 RepID=A0A252A298_9PROT|nr:holo-ACP synthase [Acetobacter orientalis]MDN6040377.1 holo-ACP synthase [Acetobacter sp.]MCP1214860.1 holo-ACP synthase [Acetobacter orientalis]MCP1218443.1 holo-ACP synthase [Acetobacter orientalis]OUI81929.1 4'-phosphopantetheinyl transferase [Acetobacter orientalis]OUJ01772.1 4'-phosphopantetheinyl transferase [Acetobacter orientalis]
MSLIAVGVDLCDMRRIERAIERFGERFLERVFTPIERARAERRTGAARIGAYAKRWAAKEAGAKALGTGFAQGVAHSLIGVENLPTGQPTLVLQGGALLRLHTLVPAGYEPHILLSMTDEPPYAFAEVIISARAG